MTKTILVVDDDPDVRNTIKSVLEKNKYKVITASSADECLKKLAKESVDLILLDIMMPGMAVKEAISKITGIKIMYVTAVQMSEAERKELLKDKDIVGFIQKPFDIKDLVEKVKAAIGVMVVR